MCKKAGQVAPSLRRVGVLCAGRGLVFFTVWDLLLWEFSFEAAQANSSPVCESSTCSEGALALCRRSCYCRGVVVVVVAVPAGFVPAFSASAAPFLFLFPSRRRKKKQKENKNSQGVVWCAGLCLFHCCRSRQACNFFPSSTAFLSGSGSAPAAVFSRPCLLSWRLICRSVSVLLVECSECTPGVPR